MLNAFCFNKVVVIICFVCLLGIVFKDVSDELICPITFIVGYVCSEIYKRWEE